MMPTDEVDRWTMDEGNAIVEQFLGYLKFEKRFSEHTAKCYGADLGQYGDFLLKNGDRVGSSMHDGTLDHHHDGVANLR